MGRNTEKILESAKGLYPFGFHAFISTARAKVAVLLGATAGPIDPEAIDFVPLPQTKSERKL